MKDEGNVADYMASLNRARRRRRNRPPYGKYALAAAVVCVAAGRPDERPHPYIVSLLQEMVPNVRFTDAVSIPGLVEPAYHEAVHLIIE